jgi:hypothetical protein
MCCSRVYFIYSCLIGLCVIVHRASAAHVLLLCHVTNTAVADATGIHSFCSQAHALHVAANSHRPTLKSTHNTNMDVRRLQNRK